MQSNPSTPLPQSADSQESPSPRKPRSRGRQPSRVDILKVAAALTETTRTAVVRALRSRGLAANNRSVDAVLEAVEHIKTRREMRHLQNAAKRLGRQPQEIKYVRWTVPRGAEPWRPAVQPPTLRERLHAIRVSSVTEAAKRVLRHGAAGGGSFTVDFAADSTEVDYRVVMGRNYDTYRGRFRGWAAREDHHRIRVPQDWRTRVLAKGLADLGGLMTLDAHALACAGGAELFAATWAAQGRGYDVQVHRGYIARIGDEHFHADTPKAALAGVHRRVRANANPPRARANANPPRARANRSPVEMSVEEFVLRYRGIKATVTLDDAHRSGSCDFGIRSWCAAVGLDYGKGEASLTEVLDGFVKRPQIEVRRAVLHALRRQARARLEARERAEGAAETSGA